MAFLLISTTRKSVDEKEFLASGSLNLVGGPSVSPDVGNLNKNNTKQLDVVTGSVDDDCGPMSN